MSVGRRDCDSNIDPVKRRLQERSGPETRRVHALFNIASAYRMALMSQPDSLTKQRHSYFSVTRSHLLSVSAFEKWIETAC